VLFIREGHLNTIKEINPKISGFFIHIGYKLLNILLSKKQINELTYSPKVTLQYNQITWVEKCCSLMMEAAQFGVTATEIRIAIRQSFFTVVCSHWPKSEIATNLYV